MKSETPSCYRGVTGLKSGASMEAIQTLLFPTIRRRRAASLSEVFMGLAAIEEDPDDASSLIDLAILERRSPHRPAGTGAFSYPAA